MGQVIEMTTSKSSKVVGLSGITENKSGSGSWLWINHFLPALEQQLDLKIQHGQPSHHAEFDIFRTKKDEYQMKKVLSGLKLWVSDMLKKE